MPNRKIYATDGMVAGVPNSRTAEQLAAELEKFLADYPAAVLLEGGRVLFDLRLSRYSVAAEHGHCVLHVWSDERNVIRHVTEITARKNSLRLHVHRMGQAKPQTLELQAEQKRRLPSERENTRTRFLPLLERALASHFPDCKVDGLRTAMDLERSFGPAYARGLLLQGASAWAVLAANSEESQAIIDGALTLGILWLDHCREQSGGRRLVEGLRLVLPRGAASVTASRMAWLHPRAAKWELYELDEVTEELCLRDHSDRGNLASHLVHAPNAAAAEERFAAAVSTVREMLPAAARPAMEIAVRSGSELGFLWNGLEFARVRTRVAETSFVRAQEISFGTGTRTTELTTETAETLRDMLTHLVTRRDAHGDKRDALYRQQPEHWLESILRRSPEVIDSHIQAQPIYSQVPAFSAADRAILDLLAIRRDGRLAVIEIKASEDLHLALQSLDYWVRVRRHQGTPQNSQAMRSDLERFGYFPGKALRGEAPLLYLVAPALRIHPATEVVLRYLSPQVEWTLVALDERWREKLRVVFRKRPEKSM